MVFDCSYKYGHDVATTDRGEITMETVVGVRKLKNELSRYLREVKHGKTITITERGKVVATLVPPDNDQDVLAAKEFAETGLGSWHGGKPKGSSRRLVIKGKSISQVVLEERR